MKQNNQKIKYFLYYRKSTDEKDRQILSLDNQKEEALKRFPNLDIIELPPESVSAFEPYKRPIFTDMIARIRKGEAQGIIAWHPDRLARNSIDGATIIYLLDLGDLKDLQFCSYTFINSSEGKMMLQIAFSQSKYTSDKLSEDVGRGLRKKVSNGWRPGRATLGYLNSKTEEKGEQYIYSDPERYPIVKQLFQLMVTGNYTVPQLLRVANEDLGLRMATTKRRQSRTLQMSELYCILTNPFYYGWYKWKDENKVVNLMQGKHEPMVTEAEFDQIQFLLGRKGRPRPKTHIFAFTGLMRCGSCEATITAEEKYKKQKNGNVHHYVYYQCTKKVNPDCLERAIEIKELNQQIDTILAGLSISERFQEWALKYLHETRKEEVVVREATMAEKHKEYQRVISRLDSLLVKYASPENAKGELMTEQEYAGMRSRYLKAKATLEADFNATGKEIEEWVTLTEKTFDFARYARLWFAKGDLNTKKAIFACLGSNLLLKDQKVAVSLQKPFQFIFNNAKDAETELERLEPLGMPFVASDLALFRQRFPVMSGLVNDVRTYWQTADHMFFIPKLSEETAVLS